MEQVPCQWCDWAAVTPDIEHLVAQIDDADDLLARSPSSFRWALAAWSIRESVPTLPTQGVRAEVGLISQALETALREHQRRVDRAIAQASIAGGDLERCCVRIASIRSIAQLTDSRSWCDRYLPSTIRARYGKLVQRIGPDRLRRICTAEIEKIVIGEFFPLKSIPELDSLLRRQQGNRRFIFHGVDRGSIQELTLEAFLDDLIEEICSLSTLVEESPGQVPLRLLSLRTPHAKLMRATIWSSCSIDWVQTYIDITGAPSWKQCDESDPDSLKVPWFVAVELEGNKSAGSMSATEQEHRLAGIGSSVGSITTPGPDACRAHRAACPACGLPLDARHGRAPEASRTLRLTAASRSCEGFDRDALRDQQDVLEAQPTPSLASRRPTAARRSPPGVARRRERREGDRGVEFPTARAALSLVVDQALRGLNSYYCRWQSN
jgi:hypothetical protein